MFFKKNLFTFKKIQKKTKHKKNAAPNSHEKKQSYLECKSFKSLSKKYITFIFR